MLNSDKQIERKPEEYEIDVTVERVWEEVDKALEYLQYKNHDEIIMLLKDISKRI